MTNMSLSWISWKPRMEEPCYGQPVTAAELKQKLSLAP
jgi:hypothetical protein